MRGNYASRRAPSRNGDWNNEKTETEEMAKYVETVIEKYDELLLLIPLELF